MRRDGVDAAQDAYEQEQEEVPEHLRRCHVDEVFDYIVKKRVDFSDRIDRCNQACKHECSCAGHRHLPLCDARARGTGWQVLHLADCMLQPELEQVRKLDLRPGLGPG